MEQGVYQVAEDFYVAVGYGNADMTMVVGVDGVILIDSMENAEPAREAMADLRRFSDKPVKTLIYTHHPDHGSGSRGFLDPSEVKQEQIKIYAHERVLAGMRGNPNLGIIGPLRLNSGDPDSRAASRPRGQARASSRRGNSASPGLAQQLPDIDGTLNHDRLLNAMRRPVPSPWYTGSIQQALLLGTIEERLRLKKGAIAANWKHGRLLDTRYWNLLQISRTRSL